MTAGTRLFAQRRDPRNDPREVRQTRELKRMPTTCKGPLCAPRMPSRGRMPAKNKRVPGFDDKQRTARFGQQKPRRPMTYKDLQRLKSSRSLAPKRPATAGWFAARRSAPKKAPLNYQPKRHRTADSYCAPLRRKPFTRSLDQACYSLQRPPRRRSLETKCYPRTTIAHRSLDRACSYRPYAMHHRSLETKCYPTFNIRHRSLDGYGCGGVTIKHRSPEALTCAPPSNRELSPLAKFAQRVRYFLSNNRRHCKINALYSGVTAGEIVNTVDWGPGVVVDYKIGRYATTFIRYNQKDSTKAKIERRYVPAIRRIYVMVLKDYENPRRLLSGKGDLKRVQLSELETKTIMVENLVKRNRLYWLVRMYPEERQNLPTLLEKYANPNSNATPGSTDPNAPSN